MHIGSGIGAEAFYLISCGKAQIIAIDVTAAAIHSTQQTIDKIGIGRAIQADARHLQIKSNSIDFVYSCGAFTPLTKYRAIYRLNLQGFKTKWRGLYWFIL